MVLLPVFNLRSRWVGNKSNIFGRYFRCVGGGITSFGVAKASNGLDNGLEDIKLDEPSNNLPLCAWRMWS